jgi:hypothetical protein
MSAPPPSNRKRIPTREAVKPEEMLAEKSRVEDAQLEMPPPMPPLPSDGAIDVPSSAHLRAPSVPSLVHQRGVELVAFGALALVVAGGLVVWSQSWPLPDGPPKVAPPTTLTSATSVVAPSAASDAAEVLPEAFASASAAASASVSPAHPSPPR